MPEPLDACLWLNYLKGSRLSEPARLLVTKINAVVDKKKDASQIHGLVDALLSLSNGKTDVFEQGEIITNCVLAYYCTGEFNRAVSLLAEIEAAYQPHRHYHAVLLWIKGCILWEMPEAHPQAINAWSQCYDLFLDLSKQSTKLAHRDWYNERARQVKEAMSAQLDRDAAPRPAPAVQDVTQIQPLTQTQPQPAQANASEAFLQLFRVIERVPAGGFGPVGYEAVTIGAIEVSQVLINSKPHRIASLRGAERLIRLPANRYVVVEVTGDSMNNPPAKLKTSGIDKGDFVLLVEQTNAKDGDIVAAEIDNEDSSATLKRFHVSKTGARYVLSPESTNPEHQPRQFTHLDEGFHIRGVALAVFKPV